MKIKLKQAQILVIGANLSISIAQEFKTGAAKWLNEEGHFKVKDPQHPTRTEKGCLYADLPKIYPVYSEELQESIDVPVNGIWSCQRKVIQHGETSIERDICDLSCNVGFGLWINHLVDEDSETGYVDKYMLRSKRIVCKKGKWIPGAGGDKMPRCHNTCGNLSLQNVQSEENINDAKAKLFCRNFGAIDEKYCEPGKNCHHASTCYAMCQHGFGKQQKPKESNEMQCICTQKKCGWVIPKDIQKLGRCEFKMFSDNQRIIGGFDQTSITQVTKSQISAGLLQPVGGGRRKKRSVSYKWQHICGGVLLTAQWAFTAAHCRTPGLRVLLGELDFERRTGDEVPCRVKLQIRHPQYDSQTQHDIMMLNLQCRKLQMGEAIWPARLPQPKSDVPWFTECNICGWGTMLYPEFKAATKLQCVELPIMDRETCNVPYGGAIHDNIMCIGQIGQGGQDSCQGDSGGGAYCNDICYGLVMGGLYCADSNYPGVYTIVSKYVPWAVTVIRAYMAKQGNGGYGSAARRRRTRGRRDLPFKNYIQ